MGNEQGAVSSTGSAAASASSAVWEWTNDSAGWSAYDAQTCAIIEQAYATGLASTVLQHGFYGSQGGYTIDFAQMTQTKNSTGFQRAIRRVGASSTPTKTKKRPSTAVQPTAASAPTTTTAIVWEWEDDRHKYVPYDAQTSGIIENAYQAGQAQVDLSHGYFGSQGGYSIDLTQMQQTKKASGFQRAIRRVDPTTTSPPAKRTKANSITSTTAAAQQPAPFPSPLPAPVATLAAPPTISVTPVSPDPSPSPSPAPAPSSSSSSAAPSPGGPLWEHNSAENPAEWTPFDRMATRLIEGAISTRRSTTTLNHGPYVAKGGCFLDFGTMTMRENKANVTVSIRRDPPLAMTIKSPKLSDSSESHPIKTPDNKPKTDKKGSSKPKKDSLTSEETALKKLTNWKEVSQKDLGEKDNCPFCLCALHDDDTTANGVVRLSKCGGHAFHRECLLQCYKHNKSQYVRCPICSAIYGVLVGTQPKGTMTHSKNSSRLPGYDKCGTITINYHFSGGTQGSEHPHPGKHYSGTSRTAYLPDNAEGNEVLRLLKIAWDRKLIFRIGQSVTTGADDQVVWNGIHHKTSSSGGASNYGYPDETYLERVKDELAQKGVE